MNYSLAVYCGDSRSPGHVSQLLSAFYDVKRFGVHDLSSFSFIVKTGNNEKALKEVCDYLEREAYPILGYEVEVGVEWGNGGIDLVEQHGED